MLGTFILGIIAGWGAPYAEPRIKSALDGILLDDTPVTPKEMALFSLSICLVGASIVAMVLSDAHAVPLTLGAALGVFGPRLREKWRASKTPDYDS